jgi:hypothetical protein
MALMINREPPVLRIPCPVHGCAGTFTAPDGRQRYSEPPALHEAWCDSDPRHRVERIADGPWRPAL